MNIPVAIVWQLFEPFAWEKLPAPVDHVEGRRSGIGELKEFVSQHFAPFK